MPSHHEPPSRVRVDPAGRIVIPADLRTQFRIEPGDDLLISPGADALEVRTFRQVVRQAQAAFAPYKRPGHSVVDELLRERREEAARENDR